MKKYKLVKRFPNSPFIGTIYTKANNFDNYCYNGGSFNNAIDSDIIEEWIRLGYFEEIKEKEYEILSFRSIITKLIHNRKALGNMDSAFTPNNILESDLINSSNIEIYSVKRKSDQEIFTIDDSINQTLVIEGFTLVNDEIKVNLSTIFKDAIVDLSSISKTKQKLFTTQDSIDIYEGDDYYYVTTNFIISKLRAFKDRDSGISTKEFNAKPYGDSFKLLGDFSTKEKAIDFIILNKPCLSLKDIRDFGYFVKGSANIKDIINLVKQKLNL